MRNKLAKIALTATLAVALSFTFNSCGEQNGDNPSSSLCGNASYDPSLYRCEMGEIIGKCMGKDYYTAYQQCVNGVITSSNRSSSSSSVKYSSSSISSAGQISSSSSEDVNGENSSSSTTDNSSSSEITLYCYYDAPDNCWRMPTADNCAYGTIVHDCSKPPEGIYCYYGDGICWLMPTADNCASGTLVNDCSKPPSSSSVALPPSSSSSGGYTGSYGSLIYQGQTYKTVKIGTQTWMAENLNYNVTGSKCYNEVQSNCTTYGRLYDWATAMALPSYCNNSDCYSSLPAKHRGICPSNWHLPTSEEWNKLRNYVENDKGCTNCAAKHLKVTSGWNNRTSCDVFGDNCVTISGNGTDIYGFSALPGGNFNFIAWDNNPIFTGVSSEGSWWSRDFIFEYGFYYINYIRFLLFDSMAGNWEPVDVDIVGINNYSLALHNVRCVMD